MKTETARGVMMSVQNEKWEFHDSALSCPHGDGGDPLREEGSSAEIKKDSLHRYRYRTSTHIL